MKQSLATDASEISPSSDLLLHELTPINLDFPSSVPSALSEDLGAVQVER